MGKTLINDSRLTPTMERTRNGRTQMFRERNKDDRSFINSENCDVELKHENKEMYAELIEDKWYWVSGCSECNGEPRGGSYIECEKHDVCKCCGTSRKEFEGAVWGGTKGWTCFPCEEEKKLSLRTKVGLNTALKAGKGGKAGHVANSTGRRVREKDDEMTHE
jgi:hypothetical protein